MTHLENWNISNFQTPLIRETKKLREKRANRRVRNELRNGNPERRAEPEEQKALVKGAKKTAEKKRAPARWKCDTPEFMVVVQFKGGRPLIEEKVYEAFLYGADQMKRRMSEGARK